MQKMASVGVRELKNHLSAALSRVQKGQALLVTDRRRPVAFILKAAAAGSPVDLLRLLARTGRISWAGGKPRGLARPPRVRGPSVSAAVVEDRR